MPVARLVSFVTADRWRTLWPVMTTPTRVLDDRLGDPRAGAQIVVMVVLVDLRAAAEGQGRQPVGGLPPVRTGPAGADCVSGAVSGLVARRVHGVAAGDVRDVGHQLTARTSATRRAVLGTTRAQRSTS